MVDIVLGLQWGDEGKGKIVDYLAKDYNIVARFQGGPNAGHTLVINGSKYVLHTVPSGVFQENTLNLIGNGVVINPMTLKMELDLLKECNIDIKKKIFVSRKAHLILPTHKILDAASEAAKGKNKIGSTLRGIGPTYMDKTGRNGLRVGDVFLPGFMDHYNKLKEKHLRLLSLYDFEFDLEKEEKEWLDAINCLNQLQVVDGEYFINKHLKLGKSILAEGAQGTMLDIDFGSYPFVTSSNTISAAACTGLGIPPSAIDKVFGVTKAYCTRVGGGPFPTELNDEVGQMLRDNGNEYGATTGRPRSCGWMDLPALKYATMINGVTHLVLTKADVLNEFDELKVCTAYKYNGANTNEIPFDIEKEEITPEYHGFYGWKSELDNLTYDQLPKELINYIRYIEDFLEIDMAILSTGPGREELIDKSMQMA